jgi:hypothetical protein
MGRNIGSVVQGINELVAELGLEKVGGVGDPGTSHPAKVEPSKANIQGATEGARSAENAKDNKEQVTGQSIAEGKPEDAKKVKSESAGENITTATYVGEDPKIEQHYVTNVTDPGTTSAASATGKTAAELGKCAEDVLAEIKNLDNGTIKSAADAREKLASFVEVKDGKKDEAVDSALTDYITGYVKSAALVGELTADMLDGMAAEMNKQAEGDEGGDGDAAPAADAAPATGGDAGGQGGEGLDQEAAALAQAAAEIAQELGCSPEDVLDAAAAELEHGGGAGAGGDAGAGATPAGGAAPAGLPAGMEAAASEEIKALREKAAKFDAMVAEKAAADAEARQQSVVKTAVESALSKFMAEKAAK